MFSMQKIVHPKTRIDPAIVDSAVCSAVAGALTNMQEKDLRETFMQISRTDRERMERMLRELK